MWYAGTAAVSPSELGTVQVVENVERRAAVDRHRTYNVVAEELRDGRIKATILEFNMTFYGTTEEEVIEKINNAITEMTVGSALPKRFHWCRDCRRFESNGTVEHNAKRGKRRKKKAGELSVEDELIGDNDE